MAEEEKSKWAKYSWFVYLVVILLFFAANYYDYKTTPHTGPIHEVEFQTEEVSPIANLVCIDCHSDLNAVGDEDIVLPGNEWFNSTHREAGTSCADCHGGDPTNASAAMTGNFVGKLDRNMISEMCGNCHYEVYTEYKDSIHNSYIYDTESGETVRASVCTDCHGIHHIETHLNPESPAYVMNTPDTCAQCHDALYYTYEDSYHGIFLKYGNELVASCSDCHTNHNVRPATDSLSTVHNDNLPATCAGDNSGEECHGFNLDEKVALGYQHFEEHDGSPNLYFDKSDLDAKEQSYYIGPIDIRYWVPLFFNLITFAIIPTIIVLMILENIGKKLAGRKKNE